MTSKSNLMEHKLPLIRSQSQQQPKTGADLICINVERSVDSPRIVEEPDFGEKWTASLSTQEQCRAESSPQLCRKDSCNRATAKVPTQCYSSTNELMPMIGSIDNMSTTCNVGLLRSMSARTVDSLPGFDSASSGSGGPKFLLQLPADMSNMTCRSTSCPSMAYPPQPCRVQFQGKENETGPEQSASRSHCGYPYGNETKDINLEGEVISDLPVLFDPNATFPDLIPDFQLETTQTPNRLSCSVRTRPNWTVDKSIDNRHLCQRYELSKQFISIGELPTGIAKGVITDQAPVQGSSLPIVDVTEKCMMWLDTLSLSSENT